MHNIPEGKITFLDIESFCNDENEENLILDYKSDWPNDLSRILCGMANVQGGMVLVGIGTKPGTRKPLWPPMGVEGTEDNLRQRVIQIAFDNIYPPVFPQIDIVPFPDIQNRAVVVIRVSASRQLHAIDQKRRVYVRVYDHSRGVENDLANLSQLEWLFQQRQKSIEHRDQLVNLAGKRAEKVMNADPILRISAISVFPQAQRIISPAELLNIVSGINQIRPRIYSGDDILNNLNWRTTTDGAFVLPYQSEKRPKYLEVGIFGHVYFEKNIYIYKGESDIELKVRTINLGGLLSYCDSILRFASHLFERVRLYGPVQISISLRNIEDIYLDPRKPGASSAFYEPSPRTFSQDSIINIFNGENLSNEINKHTDETLKECACSIMWAFGFSDLRKAIEDYVESMLMK